MNVSALPTGYTTQTFDSTYGSAYPFKFDSSGNLWYFVYSGNKFIKLDPSTGVFTPYTNPTTYYPRESGGWALDSQGNIWFVTGFLASPEAWLTLVKWNPVTGAYQVFRWNPSGVNYGAWLVDLIVNSTGHVWILQNNPAPGGTDLRCLIEFDPGTQSFSYYLTPFVTNIENLNIDAQGNIWMRTNRGSLFKFDPSTKTMQTYTYSSNYNHWAYDYDFDLNRNIWISICNTGSTPPTLKALVKYNPSTGITMNKETGMTSGPRFLNVDKKQNIWMVKSSSELLCYNIASDTVLETVNIGMSVTYMNRAPDGWVWVSGPVGSVTRFVRILMVPVVEANGPYQANEGTPICFSAAGSYDPDGDALQYRWDFNNDSVWDTSWSTSQTAYYTWSDDWTGTAKLQVTDGQNVATDTASVVVLNVAPQVQAGPDVTVNEGTSIAFSGSFTDPGADTYTIEWNFGDGQKSYGSTSATHVYTDNGTYTATLKVTDDDGGVGTDSLTVTVQDLSPAAGFAWSPEPPNEGVAVAFSDASASYPDNIVSWHWDFGGLGSSNGQNPSFTFLDNGTYTVTLTVTDDDGSVSTVSHVVNVADLSPVAEFGWSPETQNEGSSVSFSDLSTSQCDSIVSWQWDFEGLGTSTEQNPSFTFVDNGAYTVTLTVTDDDGGVGTDTLTVNVKGPRAIKTDALNLLLSLNTGDKKVDWAVDYVVKLVRFSLINQFWADGDHLQVDMHGCCGWQPTGKMVFIYEGLAISEMRGYIEYWQKKGPTTQQQQAIDLFETVIAKLVKADQLLVQTALNEAKAATPPKNHGRLNAYRTAIWNAEKDYGKALNYLANDRPGLALVSFMQAWESAQLAMSLAR